jgi:hypothetical protein
MADAPKPDPAAVRLVIDNAAEPPASTGDGNPVDPPRHPAPALPAGCPVIPLGMMGDVRYYLDAAGQLIALKAREHTRLNILALFCEESRLVYEYWPKTDDKGKIKGWRTEDAERELMAAAAARGLWSPMNKARGRGCWPGADGGLIVHCGGHVLIHGRSHRPGLFGDLALIAGEKILEPAPTTEPGGARGVGEEMLSLLRCWRWRREIDPRLLLGWIGAGFLGAALRVRPVVWIVGSPGTGKSTLLETALAGLFGGWLLSVSDPTEAGIRQTLQHDCLPVAIDEAEGEGGGSKDDGRLRALVKLARRCYSGTRSLRGGADHEPSDFTERSAVLFSSVRMPPLPPQDRSRMIMLKVEDLAVGAELPNLDPPRLRALGARILRRLIDQWPRFVAALDQYRTALAAVGHKGRPADVFGTALALADMILDDGDVDTDSAAELAAQLDIAILPEAEDSTTDQQEWLDFVLSSVLPADGPAEEKVTVAEWLRRAVEPFGTFVERADRVLGNAGIRIIRPREEARVIPSAPPGDGRPRYFAVANRHAGLDRLHAGSRWAQGVWRQAARDLPGALPADTAKYGGAPARGTAIPLALARGDSEEQNGGTRQILPLAAEE